MSTKDKLNKAAWNLIEAAKYDVITNVAVAVNKGQIKMDAKDALVLQDLIKRSIESGYHKAYNSFMREVDEALKLS